MNIVCLDLEGVLVPEIWIAFSEESGIPELRITTRDEPDYDKLMKYRIGILKEHGLGLKEIQAVISKIDPMPGAKEFLDELRSISQVLILSDTFDIKIIIPNLKRGSKFDSRIRWAINDLYNAKLLKQMAFLMIYSIIASTVGSIPLGFISNLSYNYNLKGFSVIEILILFAASYMFEYGAKLQEGSNEKVYSELEEK